MKKTYFFLLLSVAAILSGCLAGPSDTGFKYSNDIVTIENYAVSTTNPYPSGSSSISFWVKSNGDKPVDVTVDFFNVPTLEEVKLTCEGKIDQIKDCKQIGVPCKCDINNLEPFDSQPVRLDLTMPSQNILSPVPYIIGFSINYPWSGFRSALIPIIDGTTRTEPVSKFSQSQPTYGPIAVEFQPPVGRTYETEGKTITEHWGVVGRPFELRMEFKHIGNPRGKVEEPFALQPNNISLNITTTENLQLATGIYCAFKNEMDQDCTATDLSNGKCTYHRKLELPRELACNFKDGGTTIAGEVVGIAAVNYAYNYRFIRTETIIEQPAPQ